MDGSFYKKHLSVDGCATFFNLEKYQLIAQFNVTFLLNVYSNLYNKDKLCLILALKSLQDPTKILLVANTHINFNITRGDIKLAEVRLITDALAQLKNYYAYAEKECSVSVIVAGDFNCSPRSGIYEFMRKGSYDCLKCQRNDIGGQHFCAFASDSKPTLKKLMRNVQFNDLKA
mmetsp:Transcript_12921/g.12813  ORF Transcript_12921/g.12813 Transcript_12921/m.12813 type:complete len:174 (-) Transcript_12921:624-1145(-)